MAIHSSLAGVKMPGLARRYTVIEHTHQLSHICLKNTFDLDPECSYSQVITKLQQHKVENNEAHMELNDADDTVVEASVPNDPLSILKSPPEHIDLSKVPSLQKKASSRPTVHTIVRDVTVNIIGFPSLSSTKAFTKNIPSGDGKLGLKKDQITTVAKALTSPLIQLDRKHKNEKVFEEEVAQALSMATIIVSSRDKVSLNFCPNRCGEKYLKDDGHLFCGKCTAREDYQHNISLRDHIANSDDLPSCLAKVKHRILEKSLWTTKSEVQASQVQGECLGTPLFLRCLCNSYFRHLNNSARDCTGITSSL